jgi:hypothetical protein
MRQAQRGNAGMHLRTRTKRAEHCTILNNIWCIAQVPCHRGSGEPGLGPPNPTKRVLLAKAGTPSASLGELFLSAIDALRSLPMSNLDRDSVHLLAK